MLDFSSQNISAYLKNRVAEFKAQKQIYDYGTVARVGDGVVRVSALPGRCFGELLEFGNDVFGIALDLEENGAGAVLLSTSDTVSIGSTVRGTDHTVDIPVGKNVIGRVVDPIGRPLDGMPLATKDYRPLEFSAPPIIARRPVDTPLETGILAIDSMVPIGRGQRELIIGDRQTGKTSIAVDTILNQKKTGMICVYCAIGQKASSIAGIIETLKAYGAMDYSVVVASTASDSPAMQYLAPYAACAIAESFMYAGMDSLVIYDDLSKHAVAYRTMSLLLHRPPGREAYPGDVFYLHSRLLERSACLSKDLGGGSMTALPIIETTGGNISAYIPTNVISITDGQIYLESELFHSGIRPAVNTGLSVSRVGRSAQHPAMRDVSGSLRIELAQYREMAVFARFGSDIDASTKAMLTHGECLTTLFKQDKRVNYSLARETVYLAAFRQGAFSACDSKSIKTAAAALYDYLKEYYPVLTDGINNSGKIEDGAALEQAINDWVKLYEHA